MITSTIFISNWFSANELLPFPPPALPPLLTFLPFHIVLFLSFRLIFCRFKEVLNSSYKVKHTQSVPNLSSVLLWNHHLHPGFIQLTLLVRLALMADSARQPPTYPQSSAPFCIAATKKKIMWQLAACRQSLLHWRLFHVCFFPLSCSSFFFYILSSLVSPFLFYSFSLKSFISVGRNFSTEERREGEGLASIQLLTRMSCCCSCWVEVEGQSQSPVHEYTQANAVKEQGWEVLTSAGMPA